MAFNWIVPKEENRPEYFIFDPPNSIPADGWPEAKEARFGSLSPSELGERLRIERRHDPDTQTEGVTR